MPRYLVTSALSRFGTVGHRGTIGCSLLPADVYCRFLRARGEEVLFVCAGDEHGAAAELRAAEEGVDVADHGARLHAGWSRVARGLGLSFDAFGRSSSPRTVEQTQYFLRRLDQEGYVEVRPTRQMFSPVEGRIVDDLLLGTCPYCRRDGARGDQCDACARPLESADLIDPRTASGDGELEPRERRHLFLLRSRLIGEVRKWVEASSGWSAPAASLCAQWLREGVEDWRITRDLSWGVPIEWTGFQAVRHHARFDAPIAYIGATREWADACGDPDAWRRWWRADEDVRYVQFMTREDVPFHTVCFPCVLIGSREAWKLVDVVKAFERFGDGSDLVVEPGAESLTADGWRYLLLASAPEAEGSNPPATISVAAARGFLDVDVAGFADRCFRFARRYPGPAVPVRAEVGHEEELLAARLNSAIAAISTRFSALRLGDAVAELRSAWDLGNEYLAHKPSWDSPGTVGEDAALTAGVCLNLLSVLARLSAPLLPFTAERLLDALSVPVEQRGWPSRFEPGALTPGHGFGEFEIGLKS